MRIKGFFLFGEGGINAIEILEILSILGGENRVIGSLCVIHKMFPYMSIHEDQARLRRTYRLSSLSVYGPLSLKDLLLVHEGDASISFYGCIVV